jgi:RNA-directed DNA polymerase
VSDCDISAFFDTLQHAVRWESLRQRIKDSRVLKRLEKWRHAGLLDGKELVSPDQGSPHGAVSSPLLANVDVHAGLETWFETVGKAHCRGQVVLYRSADDVLIGCEREAAARRIMEVLPQRCAK